MKIGHLLSITGIVVAFHALPGAAPAEILERELGTDKNGNAVKGYVFQAASDALPVDPACRCGGFPGAAGRTAGSEPVTPFLISTSRSVHFIGGLPRLSAGCLRITSEAPRFRSGSFDKVQEPIRIFSDLHLGHPACRIKSVEQLRPLLEGAGTVIFNGDTIEMRHHKLIEKGRRYFRELTDLAEQLGVDRIHLRGNHDPEISETDHLDLAGGRVFLTHGDALFRLGSPWSPKIWKIHDQIEETRSEYGEEALESDLETVLACTHRCRSFSPGYENEFKLGPLKTVRTMIRIAWPPRRPLLILKTWLTAHRVAEEFAARHRPEAEVFVFGHTHWPGTWKRNGRLIVNTGGFVSFMPALGIEMVNGEVAVRKIRQRGGRFEWGSRVASTAN